MRRSLRAWCMGHVVQIFSMHNAWSKESAKKGTCVPLVKKRVVMLMGTVATLALGSRPRLRGLQGCGPRGRKPGSQGKGIAKVRAKKKPGS
jgi:hypothetical protein